MNEKIKELQDEIENLREEATSKIEDIVLEEVKAIFNEYPWLESFSWMQYTPYFCDGDPCYFGVYDIPSYINGIDQYGYEDEENKEESDEEGASGWEKLKKKVGEEEFNKACEKITKTLSHIQPEYMEAMFEEGKVTIYKDGQIETEEYDHE